MDNYNDFPEWVEKGLGDWNMEEILRKLNSFGVKIDKEIFLSLTEKHISSEKLADDELYPMTNFSERDKNADFVWMAATELWKRLRPDKKSLEMISKEIEGPFEEAEMLGWERYSNKIITLEREAFDVLMSYCFDKNNEPRKDFYKDLKPHIFNGEYYLCVFQDHLAYLSRWEERLGVSKKLYSIDPENREFKDHYAEALLYWANIEESERLYRELVRDFPDDIWHAVRCGDMFFYGYEGMKLNKDISRAEYYYLIAEKRFTDKIEWQDRESIVQRLFKIYKESGNSEKIEEYRKKRDEFEHYYLEDMEEETEGDESLDDFDEFYEDTEDKKIGRNDTCPCGSGKKYKKCCGA